MADLGTWNSALNTQWNVYSINLTFYNWDANASVSVPANTHKISGTVRDYTNNLVARKVCAFSQLTDELLGTTTSAAGTGIYTINIPVSTPCYIVAFPLDTEDLNARVYIRINPVPL